MDSRRVLYLINMLKDGSSDRLGQLAALYNRALDEDDDYQKLKRILDSYSFMGTAGGSILDRGNDLIRRMAENPENIIQTLKETQQLIELINSEIAQNEKLLDYPGTFVTDINIVPKSDLDANNQFLTCIAAVCTYIIAVMIGYKGLDGLNWSDNYNFTEKLNRVNTSFIPALLKLEYNKPAWMIYRRPPRTSYLFSPYEYVLRYISTDEYKKWVLADEYREMSPFLYGSPRRAASLDLGIPIYLGIGNIVSTKPLESLKLLATGVGAKFLNPNEDLLWKRAPFLPEVLSAMACGAPCIVSPIKFTGLLNQWDAGCAMLYNRQNHKCLICGEKLIGREQVCEFHLKKPKK